MRTEDDLRAALTSLERQALDPTAVLAAVRTKRAARQVVSHRRRTRALLAGAAASSVAAVTTATVLAAGLFGEGTHRGPAASPASAAAVLRQLAVSAAVQPSPALGPVLYAKEALWGAGAGNQRTVAVQQEWVSAAARYFVAGTGRAPASYTKFDPRNNADWHWRNPATLPANPAALRRHLLSAPGSKAAGPAARPPVTPDETVFASAVQFMATEPLRSTVRASMLRLMADIAQRSAREFVVLGTVTDRAGHRDIAIAAQSSRVWTFSSKLQAWKLVQTRSTDMVVYLFDPVSGGLRAQEYATCTGPASTEVMAAARCASDGYEQYIVARAVRSLPRGASATKTSIFAPYVFAFPWDLVIP